MDPSITIHPDGKFVSLRNGLDGEIVEKLLNNRNISRYFFVGNDWKNLGALEPVSHQIEEVHIGSADIDWDFLISLPNLRNMDIGGWFKCDIDFHKFTSLERLWTYWNEGYDERINMISGLRALRVHGYKTPDLTQISDLGNLEYLGLYYSRNIKSIEGIENLSKIRRLNISNCPNITNIEKLTHHPALESVRIEKCHRLQNIEPLFSCEHIVLVFDVNLDDGDVEFVKNLPRLDYCFFKNKKNFNLKSKDVEQYLKEKGRFKLSRFSDWYELNIHHEFPASMT